MCVWCGSAGNNKVVRCCGGVVVVCMVVVVLCGRLVFGFGVVDGVRGWEVRERVRTFYPVRNAHFSIEFWRIYLRQLYKKPHI